MEHRFRGVLYNILRIVYNTVTMTMPPTPPLLFEKHTFIFFLFFLFFFISLIADGPNHYHPACGHKGSSHLSPVHALQFFYRDASSALLQLVNQWLNFTYSRSHAFRYERKNTNPTFGKNRTHDFRTSRCAAYLLDYSGDLYYSLKCDIFTPSAACFICWSRVDSQDGSPAETSL